MGCNAKKFRIWQFGLQTLLVFVLLNALALAAFTQPDVPRRVQHWLLATYTSLLRPGAFGADYSAERRKSESAQGRTVVVHVYADWDFHSAAQRRWLDSPETRYRLASRNAVLLIGDCSNPNDHYRELLDDLSLHPGNLGVFRPGAGDLQRAYSADDLTAASGAKESSSDVGFMLFCVMVLTLVEAFALFGPRALLRSPMPAAPARSATSIT